MPTWCKYCGTETTNGGTCCDRCAEKEEVGAAPGEEPTEPHFPLPETLYFHERKILDIFQTKIVGKVISERVVSLLVEKGKEVKDGNHVCVETVSTFEDGNQVVHSVRLTFGDWMLVMNAKGWDSCL